MKPWVLSPAVPTKLRAETSGFNPSTQRQKPKDSGSKVILCYLVSLRLVWASTGNTQVELYELGVVAHTNNFNNTEAEAGGLFRIQG